jgi:excisionase family DNA binding protein
VNDSNDSRPRSLDLGDADLSVDPLVITLSLAPDVVQRIAEVAAQLVFDRIGDRPEYMTTMQVADYLGCPKKRIDNLCSQRRVPHHKDGGLRVFVRQEIDEWMRQVDGPTVQSALAATSR